MLPYPGRDVVRDDVLHGRAIAGSGPQTREEQTRWKKTQLRQKKDRGAHLDDVVAGARRRSGGERSDERRARSDER